MAFKQPQEHAFVKIGKDMKAGAIPGLVLLCGTEEYLVDFYAQALINKFVNPATKSLDLLTLDREKATAGAIMEGLETVSLMSERKVIFLPDFIDARGKFPKEFEKSSSAKSIEAFADYAASVGSSALLLITAQKPSTSSDRAKQSTGKNLQKLKKIVKESGTVYDFEALEGGQLRRFIEKRFRDAGKACSSRLIGQIIRDSGYDSKTVDYGLYHLDNDLKKIIAHAGDAPEIAAGDVSLVLTDNPDNNIFAMLDAIGRNRKDEAFRLLDNLLNNGASEYTILAGITGQLELLLTVKEMRDEGIRLDEIQKTLKSEQRVHEFRTKKASELSGRFTTDGLRKILHSAYDVDEHIKTGLMEGRLALEFFIAGI